MSVTARMESGPSKGVTAGSAHDIGEFHNRTDWLNFFNHTLPECHMELSENTKRVILFVLYLAIFVVGLVENLLVIWVNCRRSGRVGLLGLYILHMAIADLGFVLCLPVWMLEVTLNYTWLWGSFACRFTYYFYFVNMYSSIFFLVCLSIDRYITLVHTSSSWQRHQHRVRRAVCAGVWVLSAIIPLPEVVHVQLVGSSEPMCLFIAPLETNSTWVLVVTLFPSIMGFLLPFPLIVVFNMLTVCRLRRAGRPEGRHHCLLVGAYIVVFVICWLPYHVTLLLLTLHETDVSFNCFWAHLLFFYDVIDCFSMLHCVVNPIMYNFLSPRFRSQLLSAVVHYLPKAQAGAGRRASSSSSSTQHSIIITKEGTQVTALPPALNFQAPNTSPISAPQSLIAS